MKEALAMMGILIISIIILLAVISFFRKNMKKTLENQDEIITEANKRYEESMQIKKEILNVLKNIEAHIMTKK